MMPAVSHPAVPPPTMTTALTGCITLELGAHSQRERSPIVYDVERLVLEASIGMVDRIRQVQRLEIPAQMAGEVVGRAEIHLGRGGEVHRLVAERAAALLLTRVRQQIVALPLHREPRLQPVVLVE